MAAAPFDEFYLLYVSTDDKAVCPEVVCPEVRAPYPDAELSGDKLHGYFVVFLYTAAVLNKELGVGIQVYLRFKEEGLSCPVGQFVEQVCHPF